MLSKNRIKHINSLKIKKYRQENKQFIAEGHKIINELLNSNFSIHSLYATEEWIERNQTNNIKIKSLDCSIVNENELQNISLLENPKEVLAVVQIPRQNEEIDFIGKSLVLMLDNISDPGNFGTIIRIADWFGISNIICSEDCVELYNPKVIQATMGSFCRVKCHYKDLEAILTLHKHISIYGALLDGNSIYESHLNENGVIVIGNESNGISEKVRKYINQKISIPFYPNNEQRAESLNASVATGIICAEFRRRALKG